MTDPDPDVSCEACGIQGVELGTVGVAGYRVDLCRACAGSLKFPESNGGFEEARDA